MVILSVIVVVWVSLPLVPVMVMVNIPVVVPLPLPVNVSVDVPVPPGDTVRLAGLNVALTPLGSVLVERETVPLKLLSEVMVIVVAAEPLLDICRLEGDALMLKSPVPRAVTVRL